MQDYKKHGYPTKRISRALSSCIVKNLLRFFAFWFFLHAGGRDRQLLRRIARHAP